MTPLLQRTNNSLAVQFEDGLLMMSLEQVQYFHLNEVGKRVWELLEQPTTSDMIVTALVAEYQVTPDVCSGQVMAFLDELRTRGLLESLPRG